MLRLVWSPLEDEYGDVCGAVILAATLDNVHVHQEALRLREQNCRAYLESLDGVFFSLDEDGCIQFAGAAVHSLLGYSGAELAGVAVWTLAGDTKAEAWRMLVEECLAGRTCRGVALEVRHANQEMRSVSVFANARHGENGEPIGITGVAYGMNDAARPEQGS